MLEALVVGTPVIAARQCVHRSCSKMPHSLMPAMLRRYANSHRRDPGWGSLARARRKGKRRVRPYTWDRFAMSTADVYREVLNE